MLLPFLPTVSTASQDESVGWLLAPKNAWMWVFFFWWKYGSCLIAGEKRKGNSWISSKTWQWIHPPFPIEDTSSFMVDFPASHVSLPEGALVPGGNRMFLLLVRFQEGKLALAIIEAM